MSETAAGSQLLSAPAALVEEHLRAEFFDGGIPSISGALEYQLSSGGKRVRPAICLWLGERLGTERERLLAFALAVEVLHNALIVHDDVQDGDRYRRGRPTLWVEFGVPVALNVGDYLLAEAFRLAGTGPLPSELRLELVEMLGATLRTTVEGQALDLGGRADPAFTLARYDRTIRCKTGRYLALGWVGAARVAGVPETEAARLWEVGDDLGPAFQIRDDLLDLTPGKGRGGEIGCDVREGKPSMLFAYAVMPGTVEPAERERLIAVHARPRERTSPADVHWVIDLFRRCGAVEHARRECRERARRAAQTFASLAFVDDEMAGEFEAVTDYLALREE